MTTTPAPRRGLFLCVLLRTLRPFFRFMQPFLGVLWGRTGCIFFCAHFSALLQSFLLGFSRSFASFFIRLFPPFRPFSGGILQQFRRLFLCCFLLCLQARRARSPRAAGAGSREGQSSALFYVRFCRVLGISQHPQIRTNRGRSGTRPALGSVSAFPVFSCAFTVPFLCRHGCP